MIGPEGKSLRLIFEALRCYMRKLSYSRGNNISVKLILPEKGGVVI